MSTHAEYMKIVSFLDTIKVAILYTITWKQIPLNSMALPVLAYIELHCCPIIIV